jgi:BirA family biotin operon repressor/biotin-[acetyl-CoA-carboxylase] ligase
MQEIGHSIIRLESVDSTNNYTANCAKENNLRHGAVIMAVEQTAGKGQRGAQWQSDAGSNLTFSVFLDNVNLSVERQFLLTKIVSLTLVDLLAVFGVSSQVKWPNDIYVGDRKIAGVLIENSLQGKSISRSIIGIGLNVNQHLFGDLPATSLSLEKHMHFSIDDVLFSFIAAFNKRLKQWPKEIIDIEYHSSLRWLNESRVFEDQKREFEGEIVGVNEQGKLRVLVSGHLDEPLIFNDPETNDEPRAEPRGDQLESENQSDSTEPRAEPRGELESEPRGEIQTNRREVTFDLKEIRFIR